MNFNDHKYLIKLRESIRLSNRKMEPFRRHRLESVRQYVGTRFSDNGASKPVIVNFIELLVNVNIQNLAAKAPRSLVRAKFKPELRPIATNLGLSLDWLGNEINLAKTFQRAVIDALFSPVAIVTVGINNSSTVEIGGVLHDVGQPYADGISLDDYIIDMAARSYEAAMYEGHRFRMSLEDIQNCGLFNPEVVRKLKGIPPKKTNEDGGDSRIETATTGNDESEDVFKESTELMSVWLPQENVILTLSSEDESLAPLQERQFEGPEPGPYRKLSLSMVPGSMFGLAPVSVLYDLCDFGNQLFRKLKLQAINQKTVYAARKGEEEDAQRVVKASDLELIMMDNPDLIKELKSGGADPTTLAMFLQVKDLFSWFGGNIDSLGGLGAMTDTVGQDQMLLASSSKRMAYYRDRMMEFVRGVMNDLAYYLWYDPLIEIPLTKRIEGINVEIQSSFSPEDREGDFLDFEIDIDPYSMQDLSPSERLNQINQFLQGIVLPALPLIEAQGGGINWEALLEIGSKYSNLPELKEILIFPQGQMPPQMPMEGQEAGGGMERPGMAPVTRRINERVNRSTGGTRTGRDQALMQQLLSQATSGKGA